MVRSATPPRWIATPSPATAQPNADRSPTPPRWTTTWSSAPTQPTPGAPPRRWIVGPSSETAQPTAVRAPSPGTAQSAGVRSVTPQQWQSGPQTQLAGTWQGVAPSSELVPGGRVASARVQRSASPQLRGPATHATHGGPGSEPRRVLGPVRAPAASGRSPSPQIALRTEETWASGATFGQGQSAMATAGTSTYTNTIVQRDPSRGASGAPGSFPYPQPAMRAVASSPRLWPPPVAAPAPQRHMRTVASSPRLLNPAPSPGYATVGGAGDTSPARGASPPPRLIATTRRYTPWYNQLWRSASESTGEQAPAQDRTGPVTRGSYKAIVPPSAQMWRSASSSTVGRSATPPVVRRILRPAAEHYPRRIVTPPRQKSDKTGHRITTEVSDRDPLVIGLSDWQQWYVPAVGVDPGQGPQCDREESRVSGSIQRAESFVVGDAGPWVV